MAGDHGHEGYVSIEQRMANERPPFQTSEKIAEMLKASYGGYS